MTAPMPGRSDNLDAALGYGLLRLTIGLNFLLHSFGRLGLLRNFADGVVADFAHTPSSLERASVCSRNPVLGAGRRDAACFGALDEMDIGALVFGTSLLGDYTVLSEQPIYALISFVLLLFRARHDRFGLDGLAERSK